MATQDLAPHPSTEAPAADAPADPVLAALRARVHGTNISETTLLATDYLNHFNEIIMLLEMVPDMPEMLDEAKAWEPKDYVEHFASSSCPFRDLAIELYPHVPTRYKEPFETTILQLQAVIDGTLRHAETARSRDDARLLRQKITIALDPMHRLVDVAASIIHGADKALSQDEIDTVLET
ncbi:MAG TPA: hypothetical protein VMB81_00550 [Candidatus Sulfotelmatobacter sp.]|nr:hypothetical protein [Candidatus Sulfotelmatobacter sp.]